MIGSTGPTRRLYSDDEHDAEEVETPSGSVDEWDDEEDEEDEGEEVESDAGENEEEDETGLYGYEASKVRIDMSSSDEDMSDRGDGASSVLASPSSSDESQAPFSLVTRGEESDAREGEEESRGYDVMDLDGVEEVPIEGEEDGSEDELDEEEEDEEDEDEDEEEGEEGEGSEQEEMTTFQSTIIATPQRATEKTFSTAPSSPSPYKKRKLQRTSCRPCAVFVSRIHR